MNKLNLLLGTLPLLASISCQSIKTAIINDTPSLYLNQPMTRITKRGINSTTTIQKGIYRPVFKDNIGIYYKPEAEIIIGNTPSSNAYLFISHNDIQKQGIWIVNGSFVFWYDPPISFETSKKTK